MLLQDDIRAKLNEENSLLLDSVDTSLVFKRETGNTLDIITDDSDEDLNNLLFKTVDAQLIVGTSLNSTNKALPPNHKTDGHLISESTEFGDFWNDKEGIL